ncbi:MAG: hydrogenase iron-sulfur subunit [Pseudomonadota bacterium]
MKTAITELTADVLVLGAGRCATRLVSNLSGRSLSVIVTTPGDDAEIGASGPLVTTLPPMRVKQVCGGPGEFQVRLDGGEGQYSAAVKQIAVATGHMRTPCFGSYHLTPGAAVRSLTEALAPDGARVEGAVAFLVGLTIDSNPVITREVMSAAMALHTDKRGTAYILTKNLKVADDGLEALYRETKTAGVTYIKFTRTEPEITQDDAGRVTIVFEDETTRESFRLTPDLVIVDEKIGPSPALPELADRFKLHKDSAGFIQKENVHRSGVLTNRRGVLAVGPARGVLPPIAQLADADDAALTIDRFIGGCDDPRLPAAEINPGQCIKCLTCYRLCPYGAIHLNTKPAILPAACESCGLCVAECPKEAISLAPLALGQIKNLMAAALSDAAAPRIIAFCCSRSAVPAHRMAGAMGGALPAGLTVVAVPCAGGISLQHILAAFEKQVHGVLVMTCHMDNCHSENGNRFARTRVTQLQGLLASIGIGAERLAFHTLASNMGNEFSRITNGFEARLKDLGPIVRKQA